MSDNKNVVFLVLDSLRKDRTSIYNEEVDFTPTLQSIADSSIVYENAVSQAPWTLPSHVSMFTGKYPWEHGVTQKKTYMDKEQETFIQDFNEAGYETKLITPNLWLTPHKGTTKDFDKVENFLGRKDNKLTIKISKYFAKLFDGLSQDRKKKAEKYIDQVFKFFSIDDSCKSEETVEATKKYLSNIEDQDFFLFVNLMEPHEPYNPPQKYLEKHDVKNKSKIPDRQKDLFTQEIDYKELEKIYNASADYTDDLVNEVITSLKENNLREDTTLVVNSDHGQALGEDEIFGHQFTVHPTVTNTLMMIDNPEKQPKTIEKPVELKKLHKLTPHHAGIQKKPENITQEMVKGGYEHPSVFIGYVPQEKWSKHYKKYRYLQTEDTRTVKSFNQEGNTEITSKDLETGEEVEPPEKVKKELNEIDDSEEVEDVNGSEDVDDEEIKERLEALGYK
jgi:Arylsulfatase A and related enzymes